MRPSLLAPVLALFATSALAQGYDRQDLVRGLCQPDGCAEFAVLSADRIKTVEDGTLFKTRVKTFHASHAGRQDRGEETGYVFCSPTRPAIMAEPNGQTMAYFLAPSATQESRESVRKNTNFHALYFTICHDREAGRAAVNNLAGVAQSHGYRVALARSKLVPLKRAEDVLTMADGLNERASVGVPGGERAGAEAPRDERLGRPLGEAHRSERLDRVPAEAKGREHQDNRGARQVPPQTVERKNDGLLSGARRLTNRAFDALDGMGDWVTGRDR